MAAAITCREDTIKVRQFITDIEGHKIAAVIDMEELYRLEAIMEVIPASEAWLYKNNEALQIVRKGLEDAAEGRMSKLNLDEL